MFRLRLFNLTKKLNSTKQPTVEEPYSETLYGEFIENTSFLSPSIRILKQGEYASNISWPYKYNYCQVEFYSDSDPNFYSKYFFITDWKWELGTWVITLMIDALGTFKRTIGKSEQYILRSAAEYDGAVEDALYPVKADFETATYYTYDLSHEGAQVPVWCDVDDLGQWYIVGVIANTGTLENLWDWVNPDLLANNNGSVIYLVLDQNQMFALIQMLLKDVSVYDISSQEVSINLQKQLINPMQYIESIKLVPFKPNVVQDNGADKLLSKVPIGLNELDIPLSVTIKGTTVSIPGFRVLQRTSSYADLRPQQTFSNTGWISYHECRTKCYLHPQYEDRGKWVLGQPYSKYIIEVDPWGLIEVPGQAVLEAYKRTDLQGNPFFNIIYETWFDASTGACKLQISTEMESGASIPFYIDTAKISIDVPCHQSIQDVVGFKKTLYELAGAKVNYQAGVASAIGQVATFGLGGRAASTSGAKVGATTGIIGGITKAASAATDWAVQEPIGIQALQALNYPTISGSGSSSDTYMVQARDFASPRVHAYWSILVDDNKKDHGRPLCKKRIVENIPGYMICENAHFEARQTGETKTVTGDYIRIPDAADKPIVSFVSKLASWQSGSGDPSPSNIRTIHGQDSLIVRRNGVQLASIQFGNTVYGGSIDLTTGVLTVTHGLRTFDGSEVNWSYNAPNSGFIISLDAMKSGNAQVGYSDRFKTISNNGSFGVRFGGNNQIIYFNHITDNVSGVSDLDTWKEWLGNNPTTVVYPLATPQTYQLTPTVLNTVEGENVFVIDGSEETTITYYTNAYEEFMSAPEQQMVLEFMNGGFYYE